MYVTIVAKKYLATEVAVEKKLSFCYVGPVGSSEKRFLAQLTGQRMVRSSQYASLEALVNKYNRPAFDLVIIMPRFDTQSLRSLKRVIDTKAILYLDLNAPMKDIVIDAMTAAVRLTPGTVDVKAEIRPHFEAAANKYHPGWPWHLVADMKKPQRNRPYSGFRNW